MPRNLILLLLPLTAAAAIPGSFRQIDGDGGGWFSGFAGHPGGRVYGRTDVGGLYRTDDHGESWRFLSGDMTSPAGWYVQGVAVDPGDSNVVYQCCGTSYASGDPARGIWKSSDGGATWAQVKPGLNFSGNDEPRFGGECIALHPADAREIWAGSRANGLWKSTDAGATWTQVAAATFGTVVFTSLCIHPDFPDQIWAGGEGGAWVSVNRGVTWTRVLTQERVWRIVRKGDGTTFINGGKQVPGALTDIKLLRFTATDWANPATYTQTDVWPDWLNAFQSAKGWKPLEINPQLAVLADGSITAGSVYQWDGRSTSNGATWTMLPMTLTGTPAAWQPVPAPGSLNGGRNHLYQDPSNPARWYLSGGYGPWRSDNSGSTWKSVVRGVGEIVAWQVRFHPSDPDRVYLPFADHGMAVVTDGGESGRCEGFLGRRFPWPDDNVMFSHRPLVSGNRILAPGGEQGGGTPRLYVSTDNGTNWAKRAFTGLPAGGGILLDAVASPDNPDDILVVAGGAGGTGAGGVYRSTNGGSTFTQAAGLPAGFDYGDTFWWHPRIEADAVDASRRYLFLRGNGFWQSSDRGATWTRPATQPRGNYGRFSADPRIGGRLWAAFNWGLDTSPDGGVTWTPVAGFDSTDEIDACDGRVAVLGRRTGDTFTRIYYSADQGATWGEITRPGWRFASAQAVAVDPWRPGTVWVSTNGRSVARFTPWTPLQIWRNDHFGSPDAAGIAADDFDADLDGVANLIEYAAGTLPRSATPGAGRVAAAPQFFAGAWHPVVSFPRTARRTDVLHRFEAGTDLSHWQSVTPEILVDSETLLQVRLPAEWSAAPLLYVRLVVTH
ncbi:MAG: hypothetical protein U1G05_13750 [Kiritimatiellia bacterium]